MIVPGKIFSLKKCNFFQENVVTHILLKKKEKKEIYILIEW